MSRIGRMPITIPAGVEVSIAEGNLVTVKGPKGTLTQQFNPNMAITVEGAELKVTRPNALSSSSSISSPSASPASRPPTMQ